MDNLTLKQQLFFENLKNNYSNHALPSYDKIAQKLGYKSKNSIKQYIEVLKRENLVQTLDNHLYINPNQLGANLVSSWVCGNYGR